jgi:hypothetical protein
VLQMAMIAAIAVGDDSGNGEVFCWLHGSGKAMSALRLLELQTMEYSWAGNYQAYVPSASQRVEQHCAPAAGHMKECASSGAWLPPPFFGPGMMGAKRRSRFGRRAAGLSSGTLVACGGNVAHCEERMHSVAVTLLIACRVNWWPSSELVGAYVLVAD